MRFQVTGAHRETGEDATVTVEADSASAAEEQANGMAIVVTAVGSCRSGVRACFDRRSPLCSIPIALIVGGIGLGAGYWIGRPERTAEEIAWAAGHEVAKYWAEEAKRQEQSCWDDIHKVMLDTEKWMAEWCEERIGVAVTECRNTCLDEGPAAFMDDRYR